MPAIIGLPIRRYPVPLSTSAASTQTENVRSALSRAHVMGGRRFGETVLGHAADPGGALHLRGDRA